MQGLWYFVQPPLASLGLAASIASEAAARELRGAPLLNMLHAKAAGVSGLRQAPIAHRYLVRHAGYLLQGFTERLHHLHEDSTFGPESYNAA